MNETSFTPFPKMARLSRECIISEKIDGTNAQILIVPEFTYAAGRFIEPLAHVGGLWMFAGSRTRYVTPDNDNFGFARWVKEHAEELAKLGEGRHFGEWWGSGIQRTYGFKNGARQFSLFNAARWVPEGHSRTEQQLPLPACCSVVPVLYQGLFTTEACDNALATLREKGSFAAPGFMDPEGIVVYHTAAGVGFKKTIKDDATPKSLNP